MLKLGVVMDPLTRIHVKKDSTLAMLDEAQRRGWSIAFMEQQDLFIENGKACAHARSLTINLDATAWFKLGADKTIALQELDVILMRKDPPFDMEYIYTTHILDLAEKDGVLIVNKPQSLRDANEKLFTALFPQCCPPSLVSRNIDDLKQFLQQHDEVVYKPLDSMGGRSIFMVRKGDANISVILETLTNFGSRFIMAQKFIPEIMEGDKRILLINGEPIPYALARIPASGEIRGNLASGGTGAGVPLSDQDYWICEQIGATLREKGLIFVGIDVIGSALTEINVTSPTCIREIDAAFNTRISARLMDVIADLAMP